MIQVEIIIVKTDPQSPKREPFELSMDEIYEFGESFFSIGFSGDIWLTDGTSYSFVRTENSWEFCEMIETGGEETKLGKIFKYPETLIKSIDKLLVWKNSQPSTN